MRANRALWLLAALAAAAAEYRPVAPNATLQSFTFTAGSAGLAFL